MVERPPSGTIPDAPGSYQFIDRHGQVIYVGKASSLRSRLSNYFQAPDRLHPRTRQMVETAERVEWTIVRNEVEALMLEELAPENAWHTTAEWNPDAEAGWSKQLRCWLRGVVPAAVL